MKNHQFRTLITARAIENTVYMAACDNCGQVFMGESVVVDPMGVPVAAAGEKEGLLIANDSGGASLAIAMADSPEAGLFNGVIVGAGMGTTVMFIIPIIMGNTSRENLPAVLSGVLVGVITTPLGCLAGGIAAGFDLRTVFCNTIPILVLAVILAVLVSKTIGEVTAVWLSTLFANRLLENKRAAV